MPAPIPDYLAPKPPGWQGIAWAVAITVSWALVLGWALTHPLDWLSPWPYLSFLLLTHLYTGLFITAHDAMHGLAHRNSVVNRFIGTLMGLLFAYNWYPRLLANHKKHHAHAATGDDPDWHAGGFWPWYLSFVKHYVSWWQILAMAVTFNIAKLFLPTENLIFYWMAPAILSTFQLFYFGTYAPHMGEHTPSDPHKAKSQPLGHAWAFLSCYFFGYHHEHHAMPWLPWYRLPKARVYTQSLQKSGAAASTVPASAY